MHPLTVPMPRTKAYYESCNTGCAEWNKNLNTYDNLHRPPNKWRPNCKLISSLSPWLFSNSTKWQTTSITTSPTYFYTLSILKCNTIKIIVCFFILLLINNMSKLLMCISIIYRYIHTHEHTKSYHRIPNIIFFKDLPCRCVLVVSPCFIDWSIWKVSDA